ANEKDLAKLHAAGVHDFLTPPKEKTEAKRRPFASLDLSGKPREHKVAWEAKSVDLIGLIKHPQPVAYPSAKLPEMAESGKAITRPLDEFEMVAVNELAAGKEMFVRSRDGVVRLVGAVRANKSCMDCHDDRKEGDLLGAFSYTLREAEYQPTTLGGRV